MNTMRSIISAGVVLCALQGARILVASTDDAPNPAASSQAALQHRQLVIWTSSDPGVGRDMVCMYAGYCAQEKWMSPVRVLIWGPAQKALIDDAALQQGVKDLKAKGVEVLACKAYADPKGYGEKLAGYGVNVVDSGKLLADMQKDGWHILTL